MLTLRTEDYIAEATRITQSCTYTNRKVALAGPCVSVKSTHLF